jgi:hypothetical protein
VHDPEYVVSPILDYYFFGPLCLILLLPLEPFPAKAGVAARVRTTGVAYAAFFNRSLRLVRVSKIGSDFFTGIIDLLELGLKKNELLGIIHEKMEIVKLLDHRREILGRNFVGNIKRLSKLGSDLREGHATITTVPDVCCRAVELMNKILLAVQEHSFPLNHSSVDIVSLLRVVWQ